MVRTEIHHQVDVAILADIILRPNSAQRLITLTASSYAASAVCQPSTYGESTYGITQAPEPYSLPKRTPQIDSEQRDSIANQTANHSVASDDPSVIDQALSGASCLPCPPQTSSTTFAAFSPSACNLQCRPGIKFKLLPLNT